MVDFGYFWVLYFDDDAPSGGCFYIEDVSLVSRLMGSDNVGIGVGVLIDPLMISVFTLVIASFVVLQST